MDYKLTDIPMGALLVKFGAGSHKPGSGSASALQGMLSAQLLLTVIDLTAQKKDKSSYARNLPRLLEIKKAITETIYPDLERLFHEDATVLDLVIELRNRRDEEKNSFKRQAYIEELDVTLMKATEIPISIAELCLQLGEFSVDVFDFGFQSARGDSGVALNGAIAAVSGCLNIVELNLRSLPLTNWTEAIIEKKNRIKGQCRIYSAACLDKLEILEEEFQTHLTFQRAVKKFREGGLAKSIRSEEDLEKLVREFQNALWIYREDIWKGKSPEFPIQVLKPDIIFRKVLGYTYSEEASLGIHTVGETRFETAGVIDKSKKVVQVSRNFLPESMLFTAAHELGHALLHDQTVLHRDRSLDGSSSTALTPEEAQANKFASFFLMPASAVRLVFVDVFKTNRFLVTEANVLALRSGDVTSFRSQCQNPRGLARILANADYFGGVSFRPLREVFKVSTETMAIRL